MFFDPNSKGIISSSSPNQAQESSTLDGELPALPPFLNVPQKPIEFALEYIRRGWHVFPLHNPLPDHSCSCRRPCENVAKHPRTINGVKDAVADESEVVKFWNKWPNANIGIATGAISGFVVLDVDPRHGGDESLLVWEHQHGSLPSTVSSFTGGGGRHYFYRYPGTEMRNRTGFRPGLDFRGDGGYIVAPGSKHQSGKLYAWSVDDHPDDKSMALIPESLFAILQSTDKFSAQSDWKKQVLEGAPEGQRNTTVASLAGHLLRRYIDPHVVLNLIQCWNLIQNPKPLPHEEVTKTVDSIALRELRRRIGAENAK